MMTRFRRGAVAALLALALPLPLAAAAPATAATSPSVAAPTTAATAPAQAAITVPVANTAPAVATTFQLPRPTGPYAVGKDTLHLVDRQRKDPWVPSAAGRELMLSLFYPARSDTGRPASYMTTEEARLLLEKQGLADVIPPESFGNTRVHARTDARPVGGKHPLVVLSPGFTAHRATLTLLSEDLASRGYVVALIDHAYETFGTAFPGGRTLTCVACDRVEQEPDEDKQMALLAEVARGRAADVSFALDRLLSPRSPWHRASLIDARRIGMAGHSIGGNSAATAMEKDHRIRAGVNMDGTFFAPVPASGLGGRPFLLLGVPAYHAPGTEDATWLRDWQALDGWKRWLTVAGSGHFSFTDFPVLGDQAGYPDPTAPLSGPRSAAITRGYVGAFFDQHLRGIHQPLLDGPSEQNPEVRFENP
ncbi:alpha/beta hydrolase [Streptomyces sp. NPDC003077]|uniref:alpha/beta hydrolase family protein n=1 Tax=Streptomyces sp. NPDC003077 TaxID=3154443 RepID=UPI0033B3D367